MVRREHAQSNAELDAMSARVESMLVAFDEQIEQLAGLKDRLVHIRADGWSTNNLVRVTANASGIPTAVWIEPDAFKRSTPEGLAEAVAEAARFAALRAQEQARTAVAPIIDITDVMPDISDLSPGAPNLREVFDAFIPAPADRVPDANVREAPEAPAGRNEEDDEGHPVWLKDRW